MKYVCDHTIRLKMSAKNISNSFRPSRFAVKGQTVTIIARCKRKAKIEVNATIQGKQVVLTGWADKKYFKLAA